MITWKEDRFMYAIYPDDAGQISIICPKCGTELHIDTSTFKDPQKKLTGKCGCGEPYQYTIEVRKRFRNDVRLSGEYLILGKEGKGEIVIKDLSMTGIGFECLSPNSISENDTLIVKFRLDDLKKSEIRTPVNVRWVRDLTIGAQFRNPTSLEKYLRSYLRIND
jgi:hypothetical protein